MLPWFPLPPLKAPGTESVFLDASPSPPCGWPGALNRHLVSHPMTQVPFAPLVPFYRQPLWAGNEMALGSRPSRTAAGRGGRGSILDALWTREKPWSRSPQKPLFQLWQPTSDHQPGAGTVGTARLFLPVPLARHTYYSLAGSPFFKWNTWQELKMRNILDGPALRSPHSTPFLPQMLLVSYLVFILHIFFFPHGNLILLRWQSPQLKDRIPCPRLEPVLTKGTWTKVVEWEVHRLSFPPQFFLLPAQNEDLMAGAPVAILEHVVRLRVDGAPKWQSRKMEV
ncbi:uncharacterized protein LOC122228822 isoform X2 [Panthera leo]|uniref:uncharacterized protein LOC122228822 isoform X2 n=1 Tax=Panthera leo TaxID=9689 RepID=UPI001C69B2F4|nr:uncharacterized protein LOC122228822 isoform X2 [Panthera leo]